MGKVEQGKALIVANSAENLMAYNQALGAKFSLKNSPTFDSTLDLIDDFEPDIVIIDENIKNSSAIEISEAVRTDSPSHGYIGIVVIADEKSKDIANLRMKCGADFVIRRQDIETYLSLIAVEAKRIKEITNRNNGLIKKLGDTKDSMRELEDQDSIARVYNLPYINALLEKEFERTQRFDAPLCVIIVSIEDFIKISHTKGPKFCIKVIQQLGNILKKEFREDDILGRSWGGEFIGILPDTDIEGATTLAKRIKAEVSEQKFGPENEKTKITLAQGIGCHNPFGKVKKEVLEILLEAEDMLSNAKSTGLHLICSIDGCD